MAMRTFGNLPDLAGQIFNELIAMDTRASELRGFSHINICQHRNINLPIVASQDEAGEISVWFL
jgi:hypothetical protein